MNASTKLSRVAALLAYALTGAAAATLVLAFVEVHAVGSPRPDSELAPSFSRPGDERDCALSASPAACDACMLASCLPSCRACAGNASCLRLFTCLLACPDPACEKDCAQRYTDGKKDLAAFVGEQGCLVRRCSNVCP